MKFDKSKVCVAGLHEVKKGTRGWLSDYVRQIKDSVEKDMIDIIKYCKGSKELGYAEEESSYLWQFFYPAPEATYRPYKTIEEALTLKGKWIKHKHWDCFIEVTNIAMLNGCALINDIDPSFIYELYTMEDGTPIGVEV